MWRSAWVRSGTDADRCAGGRRLAQPARREARRHLPDAPGETGLAAPAPCCIQSLPDELLAEWITALGAVQFSRAKRPFSGATAVGMARLGGFDPEIPVQNGTRHMPRSRPHWLPILQINMVRTNGRLQQWPPFDCDSQMLVGAGLLAVWRGGREDNPQVERHPIGSRTSAYHALIVLAAI